MADYLQIVLTALWMVIFALTTGLTLISFQSYRRTRSKRLESAFVGFAFLSMGVAMTNLSIQFDVWTTAHRIAQTVPFIVGFSMLYVSLYR